MRGCRIDVKTVCLKTGEVHRLGGATRHDQELFRRETPLYLLTNVVAYAWVVLIWNIDLTFDEVEPCQKVFRPEFERVQKYEVRAVSQCQLVLAELDESFNG